jgi:hypothetical protein
VGGAQAAPSQDTALPGPVASEAAPLPVPPPTAMQKVSEMQETELKPPAGGRAVRTELHPATGTTGEGTVVGTADGVVVDVVAGAVVVDEGTVGLDRWAAVGVADEHAQARAPHAATHINAAHRRAPTDLLDRHDSPSAEGRE